MVSPEGWCLRGSVCDPRGAPLQARGQPELVPRPQSQIPNPKPRRPLRLWVEPPLALPAPGFPRGRLPLGRSLLSRVRPGLLGQRLKPGVAAARGLRGLVGWHREGPGNSGPAYFENVATAPWSCLSRRRRR